MNPAHAMAFAAAERMAVNQFSYCQFLTHHHNGFTRFGQEHAKFTHPSTVGLCRQIDQQQLSMDLEMGLESHSQRAHHCLGLVSCDWAFAALVSANNGHYRTACHLPAMANGFAGCDTALQEVQPVEKLL